MSTRIHKWCQTLLLCCAAIVSLGWAPAALAVDDLNLFELDANTVDSPAGMPDDWNNIHSGPNGSRVTTGIVPDSTPRVFTGGSKDILDISGWSHRLGSSPPKSDLLHAYAAAYTSGQDLIIYFGADRASTNGTVTTGFWFFKNEISVNANGSFSGLHSDGDVLVVADYDNGGKVGTIVVYEWLNGGLQKIVQSQNLLGSPGLFCNEANGGTPADVVCATTNASNIPVPWNGTLVPGQFFEGGINITQLIPGAGCFSSFMATSRSSTSETAEIKNFILDSFPLCKLDVAKSCEFKELVAQNQARFSVFGQVTNSGFGTLTNISLTDVPALEGAPGFFTCDSNGKPTDTSQSPASLDPGATICYKATTLGAVGQATSSDTITAHGSSGSATIDSNAASATCSVDFPGFPTLTKSCVSCLDDTTVTGKVILETSYSGQICNTNSFAFSNVTVKDLAIGTDISASTAGIVIDGGLTNGNFTLGAGTESNPTCVGYTGKYFPAHALNKANDTPTNTLNPDRAQFRDSIQVTGTRPFGSANEPLASQPANCELCINPTTPLNRCGG